MGRVGMAKLFATNQTPISAWVGSTQDLSLFIHVSLDTSSRQIKSSIDFIGAHAL
jgi:hypothetical protein